MRQVRPHVGQAPAQVRALALMRRLPRAGSAPGVPPAFRAHNLMPFQSVFMQHSPVMCLAFKQETNVRAQALPSTNLMRPPLTKDPGNTECGASPEQEQHCQQPG